jgi:hypothetical protein
MSLPFLSLKSFKNLISNFRYSLEIRSIIPETCLWEPLISKPTEQLEENQYYFWNEDIINWEVKTRQ